MERDEITAPEALNSALDALANGDRAALRGYDPALQQTVQFVHAGSPSASPDAAFLSDLRRKLMAGTANPLILASSVAPIPPIARSVDTPWQGKPVARTQGARPIAHIALALLVVALGSAALARGLWPRAADEPNVLVGPTVASTPDSALFVWDSIGQGLFPLDPTTLAKSASGYTISGQPSQTEWAISADGLTLVGVTNLTKVVVRDTGSGPSRARYRLPAAGWTPRLSADGRLLVLTSGGFDGWTVYETATGRLMATLTLKPCWPETPAPAWFDANGSHLLAVVAECSRDAFGGRPIEIVRFDLVTGQEDGRLSVPEVLAGFWFTRATETAEQHAEYLRPGTAVSPDGRKLALVHADEDAITLVDLPTLSIERTVQMSRRTGVGTRVLGALGLRPRQAAAKEEWPAGTDREAVYTPDGDGLYVFGYQTSQGDDPASTLHGLGLTLVDLDGGTVLAETPANQYFMTVVPAADGRTLYVSGGYPDGSTDTRSVVQVMDARTLEVLNHQMVERIGLQRICCMALLPVESANR